MCPGQSRGTFLFGQDEHYIRPGTRLPRGDPRHLSLPARPPSGGMGHDHGIRPAPGRFVSGPPTPPRSSTGIHRGMTCMPGPSVPGSYRRDLWEKNPGLAPAQGTHPSPPAVSSPTWRATGPAELRPTQTFPTDRSAHHSPALAPHAAGSAPATISGNATTQPSPARSRKRPGNYRWERHHSA